MDIFAGIETIATRALRGERLSFEDGVALFRSSNLLGIGKLADTLNQRRHGGRVYFNQNRHINPTNVCVNRCKFCAFSKNPDEAGAYTMQIEDALRAAQACPDSVREFHIVGGLHPDLPFTYYTELLRTLKSHFPARHIKAFTAVEIDYFATITGESPRWVLEQLMAAGLGSMPGGGAEIFAHDTRQIICQEKIDAERWLEIHRVAHELGLKTNATMLYGHVETIEDRVDHLLRLRELQNQTHGFQAFIPLAFHAENTEIATRNASGIDDLKVLAISRILLDNFDHIKAYWVMLGENVAQISLSFGVNDLDGTVVEEKITHAAGATSPEAMAKDHLIHLIQAAGKIPVERTTTYEVVDTITTLEGS
ncbi:aminofutalosine synthase MqnE [Chrysiogenes arsenatis]|uniref:aminofutalosine synthase MqnE n=1 Tax=Chrysiogenes arsenatis TaxID=309797 RepID=UPI000408BCB2|nr:aminofutalosine synthase MqnE [Chrysiogenes arsenatis]